MKNKIILGVIAFLFIAVIFASGCISDSGDTITGDATSVPNKEVIEEEKTSAETNEISEGLNEKTEGPKFPSAKAEITLMDSEWKDYQYIGDYGYISRMQISLENTGNLAFTPGVDWYLFYEDTQITQDYDAYCGYYDLLQPGQKVMLECFIGESDLTVGKYTIKADIKANGLVITSTEHVLNFG